MGLIFDSTCMLWQNDCGTHGSCMFYDNTQLSLGFVFLSLIVCGISTAAMIVVAVCYRAPTAVDSIVIKVNGSSSDSDVTELSGQTIF